MLSVGPEALLQHRPQPINPLAPSHQSHRGPRRYTHLIDQGCALPDGGAVHEAAPLLGNLTDGLDGLGIHIILLPSVYGEKIAPSCPTQLCNNSPC